MNSGFDEGLHVITDILFPKYVITRDGGNSGAEDLITLISSVLLCAPPSARLNCGDGRFWNLSWLWEVSEPQTAFSCLLWVSSLSSITRRMVTGSSAQGSAHLFCPLDADCIALGDSLDLVLCPGFHRMSPKSRLTFWTLAKCSWQHDF